MSRRKHKTAEIVEMRDVVFNELFCKQKKDGSFSKTVYVRSRSDWNGDSKTYQCSRVGGYVGDYSNIKPHQKVLIV